MLALRLGYKTRPFKASIDNFLAFTPSRYRKKFYKTVDD